MQCRPTYLLAKTDGLLRGLLTQVGHTRPHQFLAPFHGTFRRGKKLLIVGICDGMPFTVVSNLVVYASIEGRGKTVQRSKFTDLLPKSHMLDLPHGPRREKTYHTKAQPSLV